MGPAGSARRYAADYRRRLAAERQDEERRAADVRARLESLAELLSRDFGARRVGVFGSLGAGRLRADSDVDVYVDRIRRGGYFEALDRATELIGRPVDLIELSKAPRSLIDRIEEEGEDVHA